MNKNKKIRVIIAIAAVLTACVGAVVLFFKREDIRRHISMFSLGVAMIFCAVMLCGMTVYAAELETEPDTVISETDEDITEIDLTTEPDEIIIGEDVEIDIGDFLDPERKPNQLTPPGNLTLVDDLSGVQTEEKQFITVTTRNGNYFYIIIDRAGDRENVYFLNLVDEYDLLQILQGEDAEPPPLPPGITILTPEAPQGEEEPVDGEEKETPQPRQSNTAQLLIMLAVIGLIGGGAFYYFKVLRPKKQGAAKNPVKSELDEFDFDPDEDELFSDSDDGLYSDSDEDGAEYDADTDIDGDIPDFTATDEAEPDGSGEEFSFEIADLGEETPESEEK